jgi:phosphoribosylanthranilate isomerase
MPYAGRMTFVKICGITRLGDARQAVLAGANALGFVFAPSPRRVTAAHARAIGARVHPAVRRIGVFVDDPPARVLSVADEACLDGVQLHGTEPVDLLREIRAARPRLFLLKAIRVDGPQPLSLAVELLAEAVADAVLLDTKDPADLAAVQEPISSTGLAGCPAEAIGRLVLAGGLTPDNVGPLVRGVRPWGVDVSSGVESAPGQKDAEKLRAFVAAVRRAEAV